MKYFAGLDVSLEETAICVVDETGRIMKELRAASEPDPLVATLQRTGSAAGAHRFGSLLSNGVAIRRAEAAGLPAICIEARQANAPMKTMPNKTGPERCPGSGTDHADGLVPGGACQEPAMSVLASLLVARRMVLNDAAPPASSAIIARLLRSALAGDVAAQPLAARFRPYLGKLVEAFKAA
jgi:transposase